MATITPSKLKIKQNGASDEYLYSFEDMTGATSSNAGKKGMVPAPAAGDNEKYLKGDGTWGSPAGDISAKADKVTGATNGNFAALDANGNLTDSGHKHSDYLTSHQDISVKADKDTDAVVGDFASFDASGNPVDSGHKHSDYITSHQDISGKADKVTGATNGNFAALDSNGNLTDSGHKHGDYLTEHQDVSGKVSGPLNATANNVAIFDGTTGKVIKDSGFTIEKSVPSDAVFTDTTYSVATTTADGLMSSADKTKLNGIATGANKVTKTSELANDSGFLTSHQDISGKADKVSSATNGNFAALDTNGNLTDSGHKHSDYLTSHQDISGKANINSPEFTGTPKAPTASAGTNTTQIATTAYVMNAFQANDAMIFKGTIGTGGMVTSLPDRHYKGWTYKVITKGTYAGQSCEIGDMIICVIDGTVPSGSDWTVVQSNIDGAVVGPDSSTADHVAAFSGTTGKVIKDSGFTIAKSVPSDAKFTDTTYDPATQSANGLMSSTDKAKLDGVESGANKITKVSELTNDSGYTTNIGTITGITMNGASKGTSGVVNLGTVITAHQDISGKVSGPSSSTDGDVVLFDGATGKLIKDSGKTLGVSVPANAVFTDTTYSAATTSSDGLMSSTDKTKLDGIAEGATANTGTITGITMNGASKGTSGVVDLGTVITAHQDISGKADKSAAISNITRSGTTFTATRADGTTFTFTQQDNNTTYSAGTGLSLNSSNQFSLASGVVTAGSAGPTADVSGNNSIAVPRITVDTYGRVTALSSKNYTGTKDTNTTYSAGTGISLSGTTFSLASGVVTAGSAGPTANVSGANSISVPRITVDTYGRVTALSSKTYTGTTDTNTWRGIQNNLTSTSTTDSLSAAQGKALKDKIDTCTKLGSGSITSMSSVNINLSESISNFMLIAFRFYDSDKYYTHMLPVDCLATTKMTTFSNASGVLWEFKKNSNTQIGFPYCQTSSTTSTIEIYGVIKR